MQEVKKAKMMEIKFYETSWNVMLNVIFCRKTDTVDLEKMINSNLLI